MGLNLKAVWHMEPTGSHLAGGFVWSCVGCAAAGTHFTRAAVIDDYLMNEWLLDVQASTPRILHWCWP